MIQKVLRYAILDEQGVKINTILVGDPYPQDYAPGYGRHITCDFGESDPVPPENLDIRTGDRPFSYLTVRPTGRLNTGDTMDINTGAVTPLMPAEPLPRTKEELRAYAANKRWEIEVGGTALSGMQIATDRESQTKMIAEFVAIQAGLRTDPGPWKMKDGAFFTLTNQQMLGVILATRTHVSGAFSVEAQLVAEIEGGTVTSYSQIDNAAWSGA